MLRARRQVYRKRRASALIFTTVMMVAITSVVVTTLQVNVATTSQADRRLAEAKQKETFNAQVALVQSITKQNNITLPYDFQTTLNGKTLYCRVEDNSHNIPRTYLIKSDLSGSRGNYYERVVGGRQMTHPFYFGLWVEDNADFRTKTVTTYGATSVMIRGHAAMGASQVAGDVFTTGLSDTTSASVSKNVVSGVSTGARPSYDLAALKADRTNILGLGNLLGISFLSMLVRGHYALNYYDNADKIEGTFSGKGTCVFEKNVDVKDDVIYANASSRAVFIIDGNLKIKKDVDQLDGYWFVKGDVDIESGNANPLRITRGAIMCGGNFKNERHLEITLDPEFWNDRTEAIKHCVPGFWPTANTHLMR